MKELLQKSKGSYFKNVRKIVRKYDKKKMIYIKLTIVYKYSIIKE